MLFIVIFVIACILIALLQKNQTIKSMDRKEKRQNDRWLQDQPVFYNKRVKELGLDLDSALYVYEFNNPEYPDIGSYLYMWCENDKLARFFDISVPYYSSDKLTYSSKIMSMKVQYLDKSEIISFQQSGKYCILYCSGDWSTHYYWRKDYNRIYELLKSNNLID